MIVFYIILITILFLMLVMLFSGQFVDNWRQMYYTMKEEIHPPLNLLKKLSRMPKFMTKTVFIDIDELTAVRIKYNATRKNVTNLEATMSTLQLYQANNQLWAKSLTINQIERILEAETYTDKERREETIRGILGKPSD